MLHKGHDINVFNKYTSIELLGNGELIGVAAVPEPTRYSITSEEGKQWMQEQINKKFEKEEKKAGELKKLESSDEEDNVLQGAQAKAEQKEEMKEQLDLLFD